MNELNITSSSLQGQIHTQSDSSVAPTIVKNTFAESSILECQGGKKKPSKPKEQTDKPPVDEQPKSQKPIEEETGKKASGTNGNSKASGSSEAKGANGQQPADDAKKADPKKDDKKKDPASESSYSLTGCLCYIPNLIVSCVKGIFNKIIYWLTCCKTPVDHLLDHPGPQLKAIGKDPSGELAKYVHSYSYHTDAFAGSIVQALIKIATIIPKAAGEFLALPFMGSKFEEQYLARKEMQALQKKAEKAPKGAEADKAAKALNDAEAAFKKKYSAEAQGAYQAHANEGMAEFMKLGLIIPAIECSDQRQVSNHKDGDALITKLTAEFNKLESSKKLERDEREVACNKYLCENKDYRKLAVAQLRETIGKQMEPALDESKKVKFPKIAAIMEPFITMLKDDSAADDFVQASAKVWTTHLPAMLKAFEAVKPMLASMFQSQALDPSMIDAFGAMGGQMAGRFMPGAGVARRRGRATEIIE